MKVGFIGLGNVGGKLAGSLLRNGYELVVRDLDAGAAESLLAGGATWAESPRAMAEQSSAAEGLLANATSYLDTSRHIATAMEQQKTTGRYIMDNSQVITDLISRIQQNTASHEHAAGKVSERFERLLDSARDAARRIQHLGEHLRQPEPTDAP